MKIVNFWMFDKAAPQAALKLPVTTNNFKDMIHGIYAGRDRVNPFRDARESTSRGVVTLLDFARMDFPGRLNNCETCHIADTYSGVPANALPSTYEAVDAAYDAAIAGWTATTALARGALSTPTANGTDRVTTPYTGACVSCHDSLTVKAHMTRQGGQLQVNRNTVAATESCVTCHSAGRGEDPAIAHKRQPANGTRFAASPFAAGAAARPRQRTRAPHHLPVVRGSCLCSPAIADRPPTPRGVCPGPCAPTFRAPRGPSATGTVATAVAGWARRPAMRAAVAFVANQTASDSASD